MVFLLVFMLFVSKFILSEEEGSKWMTDPVSVDRVEQRIIRSESLGQDISFHVYLPDAYHEQPESSFPVLFWLHGSGANTTAGIPFMAQYITNMVDHGYAPPMLVVFPHGLQYGMWLNSKDGSQPVESILMDDIIPWVDNHYRTVADASGRLVEGFSMGGFGAARLGLKYHDRFAGLSMLGAGPVRLDYFTDRPLLVPIETREMIFDQVFGSDTTFYEEQNPWRIAESVADSIPEGWPIRIAVGENDPMLTDNWEFHGHLIDLGLDHAYFEVPETGHQPNDVLRYLAGDDPGFYKRVFNRVSTMTPADEQPSGFRLMPNYPNPFNPSTQIRFALPEQVHVHLAVYNTLSQEIATLVNETRSAGWHDVTFDASGLSGGMFIYRIEAGEYVETRSMMFVK